MPSRAFSFSAPAFLLTRNFIRWTCLRFLRWGAGVPFNAANVAAALGLFFCAPFAVAADLPATTKPPAKFAVLNEPTKPIEWGGVLAVGVRGDLGGPGEDEKNWEVRLNGVSLQAAEVLAGPTVNIDIDPKQVAADAKIYRLVLTRPDFSNTPDEDSAGDIAAATIKSVAPVRWGPNILKVELRYAKRVLEVDPSIVAATAAVGGPDRDTVVFRLASAEESIACAIAIVLLLCGIILAGAKTAVLRDDKPAGPYQQRLYSLGRTQLAFWTTLIVGGYIFLYITTGQFAGLLNETALILLGISIGTTALSAVATPPPANPAANLPAQVHVSFLTDILSDTQGMNIHRLQMAIWTVVFGIVFLRQLFTQFAFPQFDATTFGLMGISSVTYVWFKRNEA